MGYCVLLHVSNIIFIFFFDLKSAIFKAQTFILHTVIGTGNRQVTIN